MGFKSATGLESKEMAGVFHPSFAIAGQLNRPFDRDIRLPRPGRRDRISSGGDILCASAVKTRQRGTAGIKAPDKVGGTLRC